MSVRVRESPRGKTARIIVGPRRPLEVIVPRGTEDAEIDEFLDQKRGWVERKLKSSREIASRPPELGLERAGVVWLAGTAIPIVTVPGVRSVARCDGQQLVVSGPDGPAAIHRWYRREARAQIGAVAAREAQRLGLEYGSIGIRDPRTRWGSCSRRGHLSFSWRLVLAPGRVLQYVVVHEVCHLREPSHAKSFWRLLDATRPGWQEQARWLREHGQELHRYKPTDVVERL